MDLLKLIFNKDAEQWLKRLTHGGKKGSHILKETCS